MAPLNSTKVSSDALKEIISAIDSLRYGAVEITIHEGRITQIERREKIRFSEPQPNKENKPTAEAAAKNFRP